MYRSLKIYNFKCFDNISIPLNNLSVFSGINSVGKSSALQSILLIRQSLLQEPYTVNLNGPLINFGSIDDIFYEYADTKDLISFIISNENGHEYKFSFPYSKEEEVNFIEQQNYKELGSLISKDFFYLNAERIGPRTIFTCPTNIDKIMNISGIRGEYAAWLLYKNERKQVPCPDLCLSNESSKELRPQLEAWMSEMGQDINIHINKYKGTDCINLEFSFINSNIVSKNYKSTNIGFGLIYTLPIFLSALLSEPSALLCIENPEAHLHPKAQTLVGTFLAKAAAAGQQIIIETHSDHILNGIRIAVKQKIISPKNVSLNFFYKEQGKTGTSVTTPIIDINGRINEWPEDFFDEWENNLAKLL